MGRRCDQCDITDKFDSKSETEWTNKNWKVLPDTKKERWWSSTICMITLIAGFSTIGFYLNKEEKERKIQGIYTTYELAVTEMQKLEYCNISECLDRKQELIKIRDESWKKLCNTEESEEYIQKLKNEKLPYQTCD